MKKLFILLLIFFFIFEVKSQVSNTINLRSDSNKKGEKSEKIEQPRIILPPRILISLFENPGFPNNILRIEAKITNVSSKNSITLEHQSQKSQQVPKVEEISNGLKLTWNVNLIEGQNEFEIIAMNEFRSESKKFSIEYKKPKPPPQISSINPQGDPIETSKDSITISSEIKYVESVEDIILKRRDNKIFMPIKQEQIVNGLRLTWDITLNGGWNDFELIVHNSSGYQDSKNFRIINNSSSETGIQKWAVVVGISDYKYIDKGIRPLRYAHSDANSFYEFLKSPQGGAFPSSNMKLLINENATKANIERAINDFLKKAIEKDIVVIYFSSHGSTDPYNQKNYYFLTYDTEPEYMGSSAYLMDNLRDALNRHIKARNVLIFIDACHAAYPIEPQIAKRSETDDNRLVNKYILNLAQSESSTLIFSACEVNEYSQESERWGGGHGVFTWSLLRGAGGIADMDKNGIVTIGELIDFTETKVQRETNSQQHPVKSATKYDRNLPFSVIRTGK